VAALVETGDFEEGEFTCPDSGWKGKGIRVLCRHSEDAGAKKSNLKGDQIDEDSSVPTLSWENLVTANKHSII
jgi:hypothetical protein